MKSTHSALQKLKMYSIIDFAVLLEAVLESAPRFIIQLYAISVQEEPAAIIQIVSLPISFLTLAWAFTATDKWSLPVCKIMPSSGDLNVKLQIALYVTHVLLLSIRLFAICYFTVSYKWWVIGVVMFHSCVVVMAKFFSGLRRFLYYSFYGDLLPKRWLCWFFECSKRIWPNQDYVFIPYFICIRTLLYDPHVLFHLSPQRLVHVSCHCECLCPQCSWLHNENVLTSLTEEENCQQFHSLE